ncbi:hypothetical protein R0I01_09425 [Bacillus pumilus]|nr:hypothetical protein R0I01_09425 [Bacillus pumilus]
MKTSAEMVDWYEDMVSKYPIILDRDGPDENDWEGHKLLTERLGSKVQLVGDDLFVTNTKKLSEGIKNGVGNSILIKVNQIGTLTETFDAIEMAKRAGYTAVISHRSGDRRQAQIADICCNKRWTNPNRCSVSYGRVAKYNQITSQSKINWLKQQQYHGIATFYNLNK